MNERTQMSQAELQALPAVVDLTTAGRAFGIGRTKAFELARAGEFPVKVIQVGRKLRVSKAVILEALGVTPAAPTGESGPASRRLTFPAHLAQDVPVAEGQQLPAGPLDQPNPHGRPGRLPRSTWLPWPPRPGVRRRRRFRPRGLEVRSE
jgi:hypothetical protein